MGKKLEPGLIIGGVALLGFFLYRSLSKPIAVDAATGTGGGLISDILGAIGLGQPIPALSEVSGGVINPGGGSETGDISQPAAKRWQPTEGIISPLDLDYAGGYPALDVNEQGLFVNRETGKVYPIDPRTGRQRAREEAGRYIANEQGIPYGTYEYSVPILKGTYGGAPYAIQTMKSVARGDETGQRVITGVNPSTGKSYTYVPYQG